MGDRRRSAQHLRAARGLEGHQTRLCGQLQSVGVGGSTVMACGGDASLGRAWLEPRGLLGELGQPTSGNVLQLTLAPSTT